MGMNEIQAQIAAELCALWQRAPHLRFCQLVQDICWGWGDNFYMSDETFLHKLREFSKAIDQRNEECGYPVVDKATIEEVARYEAD